MTEAEIRAMLEGGAREAVKRIKAAAAAGEMDREALMALDTAENGNNDPRETVLAAIADAMVDVVDAEEAAAEGGKADRGEEIPAWQKPDYTGPLDIPQALWRNRDIRHK